MPPLVRWFAGTEGKPDFETRRTQARHFIELFLEFPQSASEPLGLDHAMSGQTDLVGRKGLRDVVDGATSNCIDRAFDGGVRRHDDHACAGLTRQNLGQELHTRVCSEPQIEEHDVKVPAIQRLECGPARRDAQDARSCRFQHRRND